MRFMAGADMIIRHEIFHCHSYCKIAMGSVYFEQ